MSAHPIRYIDLNVRDLDRSVDFYTRLLDLTEDSRSEQDGRRRASLAAGPATLRLQEIGATAPESLWRADDLQKGFRHIGFKVADLDRRVAALHDEGVRFHLEPLDATGGVRIAFFFDPDGVLLEFIQGDLDYHTVWDERLVAAERALPPPTGPRFDHVAVTVDQMLDTVDLYSSGLGFGVAGQLVQSADPRGFEITYLHAQGTVLEVFTYTVDKQETPWRVGVETPGFQGVAFVDPDPPAAIARLTDAGAKPAGSVPGLVTDRDGFPVRVEAQR